MCLVNYGPDQGKLCTIIDVVDSNKALVDGPKDLTGVVRQMIPFKRLSLTDLVAKVPRNAPYKVLKAAWTDEDIMGKWEATSWAKKLAAKKARANMSDFDRFKLMCARKQRSKAVKARERASERA